jgi:CheY-like chemotaxis protein
MSIKRNIYEVEQSRKSIQAHVDVGHERSKLKTAYLVGNSLPARTMTVLLVDDGSDTRLVTKWFLDYSGCVVHAFSNAEEALAQFDPKIHDVVITDNSMPHMTGVEMAHIIKLRSPSTPVLMYTGAPPADRSCLDAVVQKPAPLPLLKDAVDQLFAARA